ncbi:hypothetical protein [Vibrio parahaemolyticus]
MNQEIALETDAMLHQAKKSVDALFGDGYAKAHPELVSGFMVAASNNQLAAYLSQVADSLVKQD